MSTGRRGCRGGRKSREYRRRMTEAAAATPPPTPPATRSTREAYDEEAVRRAIPIVMHNYVISLQANQPKALSMSWTDWVRCTTWSEKPRFGNLKVNLVLTPTDSPVGSPVSTRTSSPVPWMNADLW